MSSVWQSGFRSCSQGTLQQKLRVFTSNSEFMTDHQSWSTQSYVTPYHTPLSLEVDPMALVELLLTQKAQRNTKWGANGSEVPIPQLNQTYHDTAGTGQCRSPCLNITVFSKCGKDSVLRAEHIGIIMFILENFSFLYGSTSWSDVTVGDGCHSLDVARYKLCQKHLLKKSLTLLHWHISK